MSKVLIDRETLRQVLDKLLVVWEPCEMTNALQAAIDAPCEPVAYFDFQEHLFYWAKNVSIGHVPVTIKVEPMKLYAPKEPT